MEKEQGNLLLSLLGVQEFLERNADALAGVVSTGTRERLDAAIAALSDISTEQSGRALALQAATRTQRELREVLIRDHMAPIARVAHADLPDTPEFWPLRVPRGRPSTVRLVSAAKGMAREANVHADLFVAAGIPVDFAAQLDQAADALLASVKVRLQNQQELRGATTGLERKLRIGRKAVRTLDSFVRRAVKKSSPELLAQWEQAKSIPRSRGRISTLVPAPVPSAPVPAVPMPAVPMPAVPMPAVPTPAAPMPAVPTSIAA